MNSTYKFLYRLKPLYESTVAFVIERMIIMYNIIRNMKFYIGYTIGIILGLLLNIVTDVLLFS